MKKSFYKISINLLLVSLKLGVTFFLVLNLIIQTYAQPYNFSSTIFYKSSGLNLSDEVADVKIDSKGYVWIITFSEIIKYNGASFKVIDTWNVNHDSFINFFESNDGSVKCVYDNEGSVFFIKDDSLIEFKGNSILRAENLNNKLFDIFYEKGVIHASIPGYGYLKVKGSDKLEEPHFEKYKQNGISCVLLKNGRPFILGGLFNKNNRQRVFRIFDEGYNEVAKHSLSKYTAFFNSSIVQLSDGNYLISTGKGHLIEFNKNGNFIEHEFNYPIFKLFVDSKENLWISSTNGVYFVKSGDKISERKIINSIEKGFIISSEDKSGGVWGYSEKKGVILISHPWLKQIISRGFKEVTSLDVHENNLYISSNNSIAKVDYGQSNNFNIIYNNSASEIHGIRYFPIDSALWVSQRMNLSYLEGKGLVNIPIDTIFRKNSGRVFRISNDLSNNNSKELYGSYRNRFFKFNKNSIQSISRPFPNFLTQSYVIGDSLLFSSEDDLYLFSKNKTISLKNRYQLQFADILSCVVFNDTIWLSTKKEVYKLNAQEPVNFRKNNYSLHNTHLIKQDSLNLWLFSNSGSFNYKRIGNKYKVFEYQKLPDLAIKKIVNNTNQVYFVTKKGDAFVFNFADLEQFPITSSNLYITNAKFGNIDYTNLIDSTIDLQYSNNSLHLKYIALNYSSEKTTYRYKIAKLKNQWNTTEDPTLNIYNIPNGSYELEIQARNGIQPWGDSKLVQFKILPPFYKTWWFITIALLLFISTLYLLLRYQIDSSNHKKNLIINRLKAEQKALRARMDPHFMFNIISSLQYLILKKKNDDASMFLNRFAIIMRNNLKQTESDKISLKNEIVFLKEYIELEKMRFEDHFNFSIEMNEQIDQEIMIPTFLIQPLVENSIKHGFEHIDENLTIMVRFKMIDTLLIVEVEDDGLGYKKSIERKGDIRHKQKESYGLNTIKERIKLYNANSIKYSFEIIDLSTSDNKKRGTLVRICIKLN